MRFYWVIKCGGFIGCRRFDSEAAAVEAAERLTRISGKKWVADRIFY